MKKIAFQQIDNTGISIFRILFGLLLMLEGFGAILTGWVREVLVTPEFTFSFIPFPFLQPLPGYGMYFYFIALGLLGAAIMLGYRYRLAIIGYTILWAGVYFMQKTSYNNHYYLMLLLCSIMVFVPANKRFSLDAKRNPEIQTNHIDRWVYILIIAQIAIVYTYAAVAKFYPDWLDLTVPNNILGGLRRTPYIGWLFAHKFNAYAIAYVGIIYDLLIVPALLWKPTRKAAFALSVFFHLFNSIVLQVGVFPYMALAFSVFFFPPKTLQRVFRIKNQVVYRAKEIIVPSNYKTILAVCSIYLIIQVGLPVRHWFIQDDVLWTDEGHKLSWRMMLRSRRGALKIYVENKETGERERYDYIKVLTPKQARVMVGDADLIWQLSQRIKKEVGPDHAIYVDSRVSINGGRYNQFIDPKQDMAEAEWNYWGHNNWILPSPESYK